MTHLIEAMSESVITPMEDAITSDQRRRIRVLQLGGTLAIGGSERLMSNIGRGLDSDQFTAIFAAVGQDGKIGEALRGDGYTAEALQRKLIGFDASIYWKVWRLLKRQQVDVVQTHHVTALVYGGLPTRFLGAKLVHTEHDAGSFERYPKNLKWLRRLSGLVHRFVAIDSSIADYLHEKAGIGRERIEVVRNGIDLSRFRQKTEEEKRKTNGKVIGWISRLDSPKRPDVLVDALAILAAEDPEVRGVIVGPNDEKTVERIREKGLEGRIEVLGPRFDIAELLRTIDVFALVSDREGLPFSLVEAMASGLPCVVSAVGGIPALIRNKTNGFLLERNEPAVLAEILRPLISDQKLRESVGSSARQSVVSEFDSRTMIDKYSRLFLRLAPKS